MSSEQVIAEILRDIDTFDEAIPVATVREYIDRLSTPAAGEAAAQGDVLRFAPEPHMEAGRSQIYNRMTTHPYGAYVLYDDYRRLQARNAEQAERIATLRETADRATCRADEAQAKLTALLDGIEGLHEVRGTLIALDDMSRNNREQMVAEAIDVIDKVLALREAK